MRLYKPGKQLTPSQPTMWKNWAELEKVVPQQIVRARNAEQIHQAVLDARRQGRRIRPIGSGHSFTGTAVAPDIQLDLSLYSGLVEMDLEQKRVTLRAGTKLWQIPGILRPYGLAMQNLGDIDRQSILGAISTSTHGTGLSYGGLASQITRLKLITGTGDTVIADESDPELLDALRVSLGAYGVVTEVTLQLVDEFDLCVSERLDGFTQTLTDWRRLCTESDHYEFFWFGQSDQVISKTSERRPVHPHAESRLERFKQFFTAEVMENTVLQAVCSVGKTFPSSAGTLNKLATKLGVGATRTKHWSQGFVSPRRVKFSEMEYAVSFDSAPEVLEKISRLHHGKQATTFPMEIRAAAADTGWLATNFGRETAYIAVHQYYKQDHRAYFRVIEEIFNEANGRPHWGKLHTLTANEFKKLYPRWEQSMELRDTFDPDRIFENDYLKQVMGE